MVPSHPQFLVSSEGRYMVSPYWSDMPNGGKRSYGGEPYFGVWSKEDERFIIVYKKKTYKLHRLICEAFNGLPPDEKSVCIHIDENPANNRASNLKWGTQKENLNGANFIAYCRERVGEHSPRIKGRLKIS